MTLDSCVRLFTASKISGGTALFGTTPWITPLPSRKIGKRSFPLSRRLYNQPRMVTVWPSCLPISEMVVTGEFMSKQFHCRERAVRQKNLGTLCGLGGDFVFLRRN